MVEADEVFQRWKPRGSKVDFLGRLFPNNIVDKAAPYVDTNGEFHEVSDAIRFLAVCERMTTDAATMRHRNQSKDVGEQNA